MQKENAKNFLMSYSGSIFKDETQTSSFVFLLNIFE